MKDVKLGNFKPFRRPSQNYSTAYISIGFGDDPFEKFIGSINSDIPDWADNHDKYIGEQLMREMRGENE